MSELVIGRGISGISAQEFLERRGRSVITFQDGEPLPDLGDVERVILSPSVPLNHPIVKQAKKLGKEVIGEMELGLQALPCRAIGITGTNGKTTTTLLTTHVLKSLGFHAYALGNVGIPITSIVDTLKKEDIAVVELSSYQLETMQTQAFDVGIILNITPDHLDRYHVMENYRAAKAKLKCFLKKNAPFFVEKNCFDSAPLIFNHKSLETFSVDGYTVNLANQAASLMLCQQFGVTQEQHAQAVTTFKLPEHRLEFVTSIDGVDYYNDSKATNVAAMLQAVSSIQTPIFLIAGGDPKNQSFVELSGKVEHLFLIGEGAEQIAREVNDVPLTMAGDLRRAFALAKKRAQPGSTVLLSPGCASFDQFENYAKRGEAFKELVWDESKRHIN